jgi:ATP-dependent helicase Lhr and Lhr-like helicase
MISRSDSDLRWWTWAEYRVNATLKATLGGLADETQRVDDLSIRLRGDLRPSSWREVAGELTQRLCLPEVDEKALAGLKFSEALPRPLAVATLARRLTDLEHARLLIRGAGRWPG